MRIGERTMVEIRGMAEDRGSPASYGYRVARGQALALADLPREIGPDPRNPHASYQP
jgi:hypothetical protein